VSSVRTEILGRRAVVTLARPERHNAFDDSMIAELTAAFEKAEAASAVRVIWLAAEGASFSAGGDLGWMRRMAEYSAEENRRDAQALAILLHTIDACAKPVVALVQGAAYGGGVGLVAACDIAIAVSSATFAFSEVKLGLIPAVISPYVVRAIGARACRRYFLTAEKFSAAEALRQGLVHEMVSPEALSATAERLTQALEEGGPSAQADAKNLIHTVADAELDGALRDWTAECIADSRASPEGREGLAAFLEKRRPRWRMPEE
jgi:methylglutaconyl-CoA hydratase